MAVSMDQQPNFKFFCRICKKGFGCGRALGGHMRAHGIGDESGHMDDDDQVSDWEDTKMGGGGGGGGGGTPTPPATNKRMYALRTNPNRLKSCRVCENCGKEFSSWKSFLEHGKCTASEDAEESLVSSRASEEEEEEEEEEERRGCGGSGAGGYWSKRKRSRRAVKVAGTLHCPSSEDEDLAHCLVLLSTARVDPPPVADTESCASASKEAEKWPTATPTPTPTPAPAPGPVERAKGVPRGMFECKACKKVFNSHQALGGHRASHKKVKGCFAAKLDDLDDSLVDDDVITHDEFSIGTNSKTAAASSVFPTFDHHHHHHHYHQTTAADNATIPHSTPPSKRKSKVHECSICHRIFASGQALGGHKRCHWVTSNSPDAAAATTTTAASMAKLQQLQEQSQQLQQQRPLFNTKSSEPPLDLNLPAPVDDTVDDEADSKIKLAKLSDLKDINMGGGSSPWLQVGIGSTGNGGSEP
ncbi:hypothetical protein H6P81_005215 [Aristolochia fimbriata]|uniref:C2H2-type domain-containing protein n=1 Tax=Aristolochia fimbriata TaxID=158543 RepID=A0AAV7EXD9_ARIFI|nr:hypothetical protein H6P81_005215 [Aristolochia fimbriata]